MQRKRGTTTKVLSWIRKDDFYTNKREEVPASIRMKPNKPTGRRKIVQGAVKPDGSWGHAAVTA
jgi:hypothetical protein